MEFKTEWKQELNRTTLKLRIDGVYREDYQLRMIRENTIPGLLAMSAKGEGEETIYEYDTTGLISLKSSYQQKKMTAAEIREILKQIQQVIKETEGYLLDPNRLLLDPEYIFCEEGVYRFCYFPQGTENICRSFHRLMDDFVRWTDYQDMDSVKMSFLLHKETMKENYSLEKIMKKIDDTFKEEMVQEKVQVQEDGYDSIEHDWIARQELGSKILKETDNLWTPVKRLLHRQKRPKWGDWDGIYIDEEEL